ncbi:MAG TPA: hypothetical protein VIT85_03565 [Solirubrobacterales bacterium]
MGDVEIVGIEIDVVAGVVVLEDEGPEHERGPFGHEWREFGIGDGAGERRDPEFFGEVGLLELDQSQAGPEEVGIRVPGGAGAVDLDVAGFTSAAEPTCTRAVEPAHLFECRRVFRDSRARAARSDVNRSVGPDIESGQDIFDARFDRLNDGADEFAIRVEYIDVGRAGHEEAAFVQRARVVDRDSDLAEIEVFPLAPGVFDQFVRFDVRRDECEIRRCPVELEPFDISAFFAPGRT